MRKFKKGKLQINLDDTVMKRPKKDFLLNCLEWKKYVTGIVPIPSAYYATKNVKTLCQHKLYLDLNKI